MSVVSGIAGAVSSNKAASKASNASTESARISAETQLNMFNKLLQLQAPYNKAGVDALQQIPESDITGGANEYLDKLKSLPGIDLPELNLDKFSYSFDPNDPTYQYRQKEMQKTIDQAAAARGNYNSRAAINALSEGNMALTADESEKQFQRALAGYTANTSTALSDYNADYQREKDLYGNQYGKITDLYNMSSQIGSQDYNKLIDLVKIGQGAASTAGAGAQATGQGLSSIYGNLGDNLANIGMAQGSNMASMWNNVGNTNTAGAIALYKLLNKTPAAAG